MYNGRSHQKWVITEVTPPDVFGSGSRPHPGKAGLQATAYAVVALAERVTVEKPGAVSLRPALTPGLRRESATSFRLTTETEVSVRSAAMRCGVPVFTVERVCPFELEASKAFAAVQTRCC